MNIYPRGKSEEVRVLSQGKVKTYTLGYLFNFFSVDEIIRIPLADFPKNPKMGEVFSHFNLPIPSALVMRKGVLAKIIKHGSFNSEKETVPTLSFDNVYIVEIVGFEHFSNYENLHEKLFENTIGGVGNEKELKNLIVGRYKKVLGINEEDVLSQGFTARYIKILEPISFDPKF